MKKLTKKERVTLLPAEHQEQAALIRWCLALSPVRIRWMTRLVYAIPNQGVASIGAFGGMVRGKRRKAEGVRKGFPDLGLPIARGGWHGLFVEMKRAGEAFREPDSDQTAWHEALRTQGYKVVVCAGSQAGIDAILDYCTCSVEQRWEEPSDAGMIATDLTYGD